MIAALSTLLLFQLLGEATVLALGWPVPGPVVGMLLLLTTLIIRKGPSPSLRNTAGALLQHLSLLFIPAGAGVLIHAQLLGQGAWVIGAALVASTLLSLVVTAIVFDFFTKRSAAAALQPEPAPAQNEPT